jgi:4-hydroxybenzoate polyprenyltransferase/phosphoserine phosphatase
MMTNSNSSSKPLCVDLDGTLIATDSLWESILLLLREHFWVSFLLPWWLTKGKAYFKNKIAQYVTLDAATLPYRENVLAFLQQEKQQGRTIILATAAHKTIAQAVASHLKLFDGIIASDVDINMKGTTKRDALKQRFGTYDYIGDSKADLPIFQAAEHAFLVAPSQTQGVQNLSWKGVAIQKIFSVPKLTGRVWLKALRPHQWVKNTLIFLPLILSHEFLEPTKLVEALVAFIAFSLVASSGYIINDLLDLAADRAHPTKKHRPFASGVLPIHYGLPLFVILVSLSTFISMWWLSIGFTGMVFLYLLITITYSFVFKQKMIVDVLVLAGLFTHRILAGGIAVTVSVSSWLLAFSMFFFMSLAFLKRYIELLQLTDKKMIKRRGYQMGDIEMVASVGPTSGYLAILVFALYINSETVATLYQSSYLLWLVCPLLLYWITRVWFLAHRQQLQDDPVLFALKDSTSWFVIACISLFMLLAKFV